MVIVVGRGFHVNLHVMCIGNKIHTILWGLTFVRDQSVLISTRYFFFFVFRGCWRLIDLFVLSFLEVIIILMDIHDFRSIIYFNDFFCFLMDKSKISRTVSVGIDRFLWDRCLRREIQSRLLGTTISPDTIRWRLCCKLIWRVITYNGYRIRAVSLASDFHDKINIWIFRHSAHYTRSLFIWGYEIESAA